MKAQQQASKIMFGITLDDHSTSHINYPNKDMQQLVEVLTTLQHNRKMYDTTNDSIYMPATRGTWVKRFKRRAECLHQLYKENAELYTQFNSIMKRMEKHDVAQYNNHLKTTDYVKLRNENAHIRFMGELLYQTFFMKSRHDLPFITEDMVLNLTPDMEKHMPRSEFTMLAYALLTHAKYQISLLNDAESGQEMVRYAQKMLKFENQFDKFSNDYVRVLFLTAYQHLLYVGLIRQGALTPQQSLSYWQHARHLRDTHPDLFNNPEYKDFLSLLNRNINDYDIHFTMGYVMPKHGWDYHEPLGDSLANCFLQRMESSSTNLNENHFGDYASAMCYMGKWSADEMYNNAINYYATVNRTYNNVKVNDVVLMAYNIKNINYMLNLTSLPNETKRKKVTESYEKALEFIRVCEDRQYDFELADVVRKMLCDKVAKPLLSTSQRLYFIKRMMLSTQVQTYAHSIMLSYISQLILDGIIESNPQLLVGSLGIQNVEDVNNRCMELSAFIDNAAILHDVGKLTMIEVVRNDYHPLTDHEFSILKQHPERGIQFLDEDSDLLKYKDIILGHHKWFDESNGYPESFNHNKSPLKFIIELITIADCMSAATDRLGRNYSNNKTGEDVLNEIQSGAGTRYNPDIVKVIMNNEDMKAELCNLLDRGWLYNYYQVYLDYFGLR